MPISETDEIAVAPADGPPVNPECAALLRLARAHFGADAALIVVSAADLGVDQVLSRCDKALYLAKARGRNRIELHGEPE